ncbi:flagellar filament capping protein FliD [Thiocystis violascens]|uniref:Flagellar hook-associated protein 2 n=1 Tax=Thiocystis violascens (strain ATCC 17096 / DSM 198 / 6111) TaxID=765911 RepID=I3Y757_THIV6|nr:flagellar filament capping protein FliD [Thiocystis violascens]AFL72825.1 flagellar capping protein [Thiocystis violascens DSM 198]
MDTNIIGSLGAGSGIDIAKLVSQLTEVERAPQQQLIDTRQKKLEAQISGYGQLKSALDTLKTAMGSLGTADIFNARSVAVPTSDAITADSVSPGAQTGSYKIDVLAVASAHSLATQAQDERDGALGKSGNLTIGFGEWTYNGSDEPTGFATNAERAALSIEVEATDSLDSIAAKINAQNAGVQAAVLKVDGQYQLTLTAPSGVSNALRVSVDDTSLNAFAFNESQFDQVAETQQGADASLKINGLAVTRESNSIDDVIQGFAFTINKISTESLNFSVTADKGSAEEAVRGFVEAYNAFQETTQKLIGYSRDDDNNLVRGDLAGDSAARTAISRLREQIGGAVPGIASGFTALTNVGIRTERDGSLSISEDEFTDAFAKNFDLIGELFASKTTSANSAVKVNQGTFAASATAGTYAVKIDRDPTHGQTQGTPITVGGFNAGTDKFDTPLTAAGAAYSFKINVDGTNSNLIELNGTYNSADDLRADLQSRINGDASLKAAGIALDVGYDDTTDSFSFTSRDYGAISQVKFTETGASLGALGIALTQARIVGDAVSQESFDAATETFTTPLNAATGDYSFKLSVNGVASGALQLSGTYTDAETLRADLQTQINADANVASVGGLDVTYDPATNAFSFVSRTGGAASAVAFTETGDDMAKLGIGLAMTGTRGVDVAGSIDGVAGFGAGNVLLPDIDSKAYGLNLSVSAGAKAQSEASGTAGFEIGFSRGFAGELSKLIDNFLGSTGIVKTREDGIQTQLDGLDENKTKLDRRMEGVSARLLAQFTAMENIVNSLQGTGSQLEGLVDRLPFTASSS